MDSQKLFDYGLWYYCKYFPAARRLQEKVFAKSQNNLSLTQEVMSALAPYIHEESTLESRLRFMLDRNKNISYIRRNLMSKGYEKALVEEILQKYLQEKGGSLLRPQFLKTKIEKYLLRGKSRRFIENTLGETAQDRVIIAEIFGHLQSEQTTALSVAYKKIAGKYPPEKIIQKLLSQGFSYDTVKAILSSGQN